MNITIIGTTPSWLYICTPRSSVSLQTGCIFTKNSINSVKIQPEKNRIWRILYFSQVKRNKFFKTYYGAYILQKRNKHLNIINT